jgi:hypothetical protein
LALATENEETGRFLGSVLSRDIAEVLNERNLSHSDRSSYIKPSADAIDYSNVQELAEDKSIPMERAQIQSPRLSIPISFPSPQLVTSPTIFPHGQQELPQELDVKKLYPAFEKDKILKFSELFAPRNYTGRILPFERLWELGRKGLK